MVESFLEVWLLMCHGVAAAVIWPLAAWILVSGLDDLFVLAVWLIRARRPRVPPPGPDPLPEKRIAIFVPLWQEHAVIHQMLEHNIDAIRYEKYAFFVGVYPNDDETREAVEEAASRSRNVYLCVCPHPGPTSKADCLNWIYQNMLLHEERLGVRFEVIVTHDAEDIIHPESLRWINHYMDHGGMVQTPVLAMPTAFREFTHGLYCDDFAEFHGKDMMVREYLGGFIPSSGVGTGYRRDAIEKLAAAESNRLFEPGSLTEDYENGLRLQRLGVRQLFAPVHFDKGEPVATREYFPRGFRAARRQRTRWVTGIVLQGWQRHGWRAGWRQLYWLWRDRKGLVGNPVSFLSNLLFVYGVITWHARPIRLDNALESVLIFTMIVGSIHLAARASFSARIYGWRFALAAPLRQIYGNCLNAQAAILATARFVWARINHHPLVWVKTEHAYPSRTDLAGHRRPIEQILVDCGFIEESDLKTALTESAESKLSDYLMMIGKLSEQQLYIALSIQQSLPIEAVDPREIRPSVARALPASVVRGWKVLPFRVFEGSLYVASPQLPTERLQIELRRYTHLEIRYHLITPSNYKELEGVLL